MPSADEYAQQLKALFPPGLLWFFEPGSVLDKTCKSLAQEFARVDARIEALKAEFLPSTANEMISDWERVLGIPDACQGDVSTVLSERQAAAVQKFTSRGDLTSQFYVSLLAKLGITATVQTFKPARAGQAAAGDPINGEAWAYAILLHLNTAPAPGGTYIGDPVGSYLGPHGQEVLECIIRHAAGGHTPVLFAYEG